MGNEGGGPERTHEAPLCVCRCTKIYMCIYIYTHRYVVAESLAFLLGSWTWGVRKWLAFQARSDEAAKNKRAERGGQSWENSRMVLIGVFVSRLEWVTFANWIWIKVRPPGFSPSSGRPMLGTYVLPPHPNKGIPPMPGETWWCSVGNAGMKPGVPLKDTTRWISFLGFLAELLAPMQQYAIPGFGIWLWIKKMYQNGKWERIKPAVSF